MERHERTGNFLSTEYRKKDDKPDAERGDPDQPSRHIADFKDFFHQLDDGRRVSNYKVHNMYGAMMTKASGEGLDRLLDRLEWILLYGFPINNHCFPENNWVPSEWTWRQLRPFHTL